MDPAKTVAVIGLGAMGLGMARSLLRGGLVVRGCDVNPDAVATLVADGGIAAVSPAAAAEGADIVAVVVVSAAQAEAVLFGENGAVAALRPGAVVIASPTMAPQ